MAAREVKARSAGFTLLEVMVVVAIVAVMVLMAGNALSGARRVARVSGAARLLMQRLQTVRTSAVGQGNAQGLYIGPNGPGAAGVFANQSFNYVKANATASPVSYTPLVDKIDGVPDTLPISGAVSLVTVTGAGVVQPAPFDIGFDVNGAVTVTPAPLSFPYCIQVTDPVEFSVVQWLILFNDGTVKVQRDETWCP